MKIFNLQKKVIRIMVNIRSRASCKEVFKELRILQFYSQYIYSLLTYVLSNNELLISNSMISNTNNGQKNFTFHFRD
jgi:hypothetical protein